MAPPPAAPVAVGGEAAAVAGAVGQGVRQGSGKGEDEEIGGSCEGTREQCAVRDGTRGPGHTELPIADNDPTGGKLENPAPTENTATTLTTPDQSGMNNPLITISPESQPGKNDGIFINPRPVENTGTSYISESSDKRSSISAGDFFKGTAYTDKVKNQASSGDYHSFPESVDAHAGQGTVSVITGGDGIERLKLEISGNYRGKEGIFEYIREPNGSINHRLFVPK
ncbi:hypothetical protein [Dickeya dianthicola]|uniref:hypothetical protein n=1 Tax=Dickeya dianthicola TaxID=204039 RepID=UPI0003D7944F|nr:hypothetical protein [Dickeya dianthicola]MCI4005124.1 hypothetical protein [Dickeya dianthicola]MCI4071227.1 hypothetical protein [Dickeya dianthicola]MCI4117062.1 hypothetical protein [Dickeya dianthicola]MCI4121525.1 hypothetical protein [Dickeya dianthicola]MCI4122846.1 hypothetical protein [Dickeya dianthicola]